MPGKSSIKFYLPCRCIHPNHPSKDIRYAIKFVFNFNITSGSLDFVFQNEFLNVQNISHPNVVKIFHTFTDVIPPTVMNHIDPSLHQYISHDEYGRQRKYVNYLGINFPVRFPLKTKYFVMELYNQNLGTYLAERSQKKRLSQKKALSNFEILGFSYQLFSAFSCCVENKLVHKDVKLDNVMVDTTKNRLILVDFGCSVSVPEDFKITYHNGSLLGNVAYDAPEVHNGFLDKNSFNVIADSQHETCS